MEVQGRKIFISTQKSQQIIYQIERAIYGAFARFGIICAI